MHHPSNRLLKTCNLLKLRTPTWTTNIQPSSFLKTKALRFSTVKANFNQSSCLNFVRLHQFKYNQSRLFASLPDGNGEPPSTTEETSNKSQEYRFGDGRTVKEVTERIACIQLVLARWGLEAALRHGSPADRVQSAFNGINQASQLPEVKDIMTSKEKQLLLLPLGKWSQAEIQETEGLWEEFGVFQWSLGILKEMPAYFEVFHRSQLFKATGIAPGQPNTISDFITLSPAMCQPRDQDAIVEQLTQAEIWHWRSQAQSLLGLKDLESQVNEDEEVLDYANLPVGVRRMIEKLPQAIANTSSLAYSRGIILLTTEDDFGIPVEVTFQFQPNVPNHPDVIPYRKLPEPVIEQLTAIAESRYHALAYISGSLADFDDPISRLKEGQAGSVLGGMPHLWAPENDEGTGDGNKNH